MAALILSFLLMAAVGSAAALAVHLAALFGIIWPFEHYAKFLGTVCLVVLPPTTLAMGQALRRSRQGNVRQGNGWMAALRNCPRWVRRSFYAVYGYALTALVALPFMYGGSITSPANRARCLSVAMFAMYAIAGTMLYSALRVRRSDLCETSG